MKICEQLKERLSGIEGLPALPLVLQQIQKVMSNPRSSMSQIAMVVAKDQALASRAIRLVNSAYYARANPVSSVQQAIVTLGLKTLNNLMLGLSVIKMFHNSEVLGYDPQSFWKHSFGTAILARKLASLTRYQGEIEECFVAGLLHDMGRLVLEQYLHADFIKALTLTQGHDSALLVREMEVFGFSHADTGAWLGRAWNIPRQFTIAMEFHHSPESLVESTPAEKKMLHLVTAANELCSDGRIGASGESRLMTRAVSGFSELTEDMKVRLLEETRKEVDSTLEEWNRE